MQRGTELVTQWVCEKAGDLGKLFSFESFELWVYSARASPPPPLLDS